MEARKPLALLMRNINCPVKVKLKNNYEYEGTMVQCDNCMNLVLDKTIEKYNGNVTVNYGSVFIRGSNILYIRVERT